LLNDEFAPVTKVPPVGAVYQPLKTLPVGVASGEPKSLIDALLIAGAPSKLSIRSICQMLPVVAVAVIAGSIGQIDSDLVIVAETQIVCLKGCQAVGLRP